MFEELSYDEYLLSVSYYLTSHKIIGNVEKLSEDTERKESMPLRGINRIASFLPGTLDCCGYRIQADHKRILNYPASSSTPTSFKPTP